MHKARMMELSHRRGSMPYTRSKRERRACRACDWCRAKKKRCIISSKSANRPLCDECKCSGQICVFSDQRSSAVTADSCIKQERDLLAKGVKILFNMARVNHSLSETPSQKATNNNPSLAYILGILDIDDDLVLTDDRQVTGKKASLDAQVGCAGLQPLVVHHYNPKEDFPDLQFSSSGNHGKFEFTRTNEFENLDAHIVQPQLLDVQPSTDRLELPSMDQTEAPMSDHTELSTAAFFMADYTDEFGVLQHPEVIINYQEPFTVAHTTENVVGDEESPDQLLDTLYPPTHNFELSSTNNHLLPSFADYLELSSLNEAELSIGQKCSEAYVGVSDLVDTDRFHAQEEGEDHILESPNFSLSPNWPPDWAVTGILGI